MRKSFKTNSIKNSFKIFFFLNSNTALCFEFLSTYICELRQQYSIVVWLSKNKKRSPLHLSRTGHLPATRWMNSAKLRSKVLQKLRYPYTAVIILKDNVKKVHWCRKQEIFEGTRDSAPSDLNLIEVLVRTLKLWGK